MSPKTETDQTPAKGGLEGDPADFMALTEIGIISHLAETELARLLPAGMTPAQFAVLNHLLRLNTQQTIGELASALQVSQPTMSSTVRRLEGKRLIELQPDAADGRIRRVSVTAEGKRMRERGAKAAQASLSSLSDALSAREWQTLLPLLTKLRVAMDAARS